MAGVAHNLSFRKKLFISLARVVAGPSLFCLLSATPIRAESQSQNPSDKAPAYDHASIKADDSENGGFKMMFVQDGFRATSVTLRMLIRTAYGVEDSQIFGAPNWLNSEKYDIEARIGLKLESQKGPGRTLVIDHVEKPSEN